MKKIINSLVMLALSVFALVVELTTGQVLLEVVVPVALLVLASLIWVVFDIVNVKKK